MRWLPVTLLNVITVAVLLSQTPARLMAEPDGASRLHWLANGETFAATVLGDHLYVGGTFTRIAPRSAALGSAYMLSTTTGAALPGLPLVDGEVLAVEPDGSGGYYLGGSFRRVGGIVRHGLAHVLADGSVSPSFAPVLETFGPTAIRSIARGPSAVYVLGSFHVVNGTPRLLAAALDPNTAALKSWTLATPAGQLFFDPDRTFFRLGQLFITGRAEGNFVVATADQTTGVFDRQITIDTFLDLNRPSAFVGTRLVTTTRTGTTSQTRPSLVA